MVDTTHIVSGQQTLNISSNNKHNVHKGERVHPMQRQIIKGNYTSFHKGMIHTHVQMYTYRQRHVSICTHALVCQQNQSSDKHRKCKVWSFT